MTQQTQGMGRLALQSAIDLIDGKKLPADQLQESDLTTKYNVEPYIAKHP
jgi:ribose transport system substrate-binding protein